MKFPKIFTPKRSIVRVVRGHMTGDNGSALAALLAGAGHNTFDASAVGALLAAPTASIDLYGNQRGHTLQHPVQIKTADGQMRTVDSTGAFMVGELERLDPTMNMPLVDVSWSRDIDLREDVSLADELSSYTLSQIAAAGGLAAGAGIRNGKAWIGKVSNQIGGVSVDISKITNPLTLWGMEVKYSIPELESAARAGRPIDEQKLEGLRLKQQMDVDEQVYVGDAQINVGGLCNHSLVTNVANLPNGAGGSPRWSLKTADEILTDVNAILTSAWRASGYAQIPNRLLLPPTVFGMLTTRIVSSAGSVSILRYLLENNILTKQGKGDLEIFPVKWLVGCGVGGTIGTEGGVDRMVAYRKDKRLVRFPMTGLQRTPVQFSSIYHSTTYFNRLGVVEFVYPETAAYRDGL